MRIKLKASWLGLVSVLALAFAGASLVDKPLTAPAARPLPELIPAGPLLVLQAKDFSSLVRDWNESPEKELWLASSNYGAFSRSRLYLRLCDAQSEFATAAGLPPDMSLVESVAGADSALALYDIGKLEFLYVTRMPSAKAVENALWRGRGNYEPRKAAGLDYFVRVDKTSHRTVAFATTDDLLLLATREDLLAGALTLIAGQKQLAVGDEPWFVESVRAVGQPPPDKPDLRLVVNLATVIRSPYFRSYWIERNIGELRQYRAVISDLYRSPAEIREKRVLLRSNQSTAPPNASGVLGEVLRLVPADTGLYRAWAEPRAEDALNLLTEKILSPQVGPPPASKIAPAVSLTAGQAGTEADLETRIDEVPLPTVGSRFRPAELIKLLGGSKLESALTIESSEALGDGVFVMTPSAVVLLAGTDWDGDQARHALAAAVDELWTSSDLGVTWVAHQKGQETYYEVSGLARLSMATRGRLLIVANSPIQLVAVLDAASHEATGSNQEQGLVYAARFNHAGEAENFTKMMGLIDYPGSSASPAPNLGLIRGRQPQFFSQNLSSLSQTLSRLGSASIAVSDAGPSVSVTAVYRIKQSGQSDRVKGE